MDKGVQAVDNVLPLWTAYSKMPKTRESDQIPTPHIWGPLFGRPYIYSMFSVGR